ncbi:MAG: hypothetical protein MRK01_02980 [Candidatus Scalindua sp.]|nr:hypothetical protein [Candidatus Scalindua sp.]
MKKNNFTYKMAICFSLFCCCELNNTVLAHEGHDHPHNTEQITIGRSTYTHFKSILSVYHEVFDDVSSGQLNHVPVSAQMLINTAKKGIETESRNPGLHMMQCILEGAQKLQRAECLQDAQNAFALISDAISPFLQSWPNLLKNNKINLFECKAHGHYWLQPHDASPVCPYAYGVTTKCSIVTIDIH